MGIRKYSRNAWRNLNLAVATQYKHSYHIYYSAIIALIAINLSTLLDIPYFRQVFGFLFLTFLPGLLILRILKLNKIEPEEKLVLSVGLSISFLMFFGLLINNLSLIFGYLTPLSTISLLITLNLATISLILAAYLFGRNVIFFPANFDLTVSELAFLIVPVLLPALSIFGGYEMNMRNSNILLMSLSFLVPAYVVFISILGNKFPKKLYPIVILLISTSLLLLLPFRSNYLIGVDVHVEYYTFQSTLDNLHWKIFGGIMPRFNTCISSSLLPAIYESILNTDPEFLYRIFYSSIFSISPLVIYITSKKYLKEKYAFLASFFYMSQETYLWTEANPRTNTAILFFALAIMVLVSNRIRGPIKKILSIVFIASSVVSHYSTTYIFFFILLVAFIGTEIFSKKCFFKKNISSGTVILFFSMIFLWYSQLTESAFTDFVVFIKMTFDNLNKFFLEESREEDVYKLLGKGIMEKGVAPMMEFTLTWLTFIFIGVGIIAVIRKYRETLFLGLNFKKPSFLKEKIEIEYFIIALACVGLLVAIVVLPYVSRPYDLYRVYLVAVTSLSVFFIIGGMTLSKYFFSFKKKISAKRKNIDCVCKFFFIPRKINSEVWGSLIILLVLVPYFLCNIGVIRTIFGDPRVLILNSKGEQYERMYIYDQEVYGSKWLKEYMADQNINTDSYGYFRLLSYGKIVVPLNYFCWLSNPENISGYIYLRYQNVVSGKLIAPDNKIYNMIDIQEAFAKKNLIYDNGFSNIYY